MEKWIINVWRINILVSVFIVVVYLIGIIMKERYSYRWKYVMWLITGIFLLFPFPVFSERAPVQIEIQREIQPVTREVTGYIRQEPTKENTGKNPGTGSEVTDFKQIGQTAETRRDPAVSEMSLREFSYLFFIIWMAGIFIMGIYRIGAYDHFRKTLMRWAIPQEEPGILSLYQISCQSEHVRKPPQLMCSSALQTPLLAGIRRIRLYLPEKSYTDQELELIFQHELTHYRKKDLWYKTFLTVVNTVYWFNPFLYLVRYEAQKDIEYLCDRTVIEKRSKEECALYSRLLLKTASGSGYAGNASAGLNDGAATLKERIVLIMKKKKMKYGVIPALFCVMILLLSNVLVGCTVGDEKNGNKEEAASGEKITIENPEEIAYLQIGTMRIDKQEYPSAKLEALLKNLEGAVPVETGNQKELQRGEDIRSILLIDGEGNKEKFDFFLDDGKIYMENEEGAIYENVEFIEDYVGEMISEEENTQIEEEPRTDENSQTEAGEEAARFYLERFKIGVENRMKYGFGIKGDVYTEVALYQKDGFSQEEAVQMAEKSLKDREIMYEYARELGCFPTEEEQKEIQEKYWAGIEDSEYYEEQEKICQSAGMTFREYFDKSSSGLYLEVGIRVSEFLDNDFKDGKDIVNGQVVYEDVQSYRNAVLNSYEPKSKEYQEFIKELEQAIEDVKEENQ